MNAPFLIVPALDQDALMARKFGQQLDLRMKNERRIVFALLTYLETHGFEVRRVYDGDDYTECTTPKEAMELIFNLDEVSVRVRKSGFGEHGVLLIMGNDNDIISDWTFHDDDRDGFRAVMDAFDVDNLPPALDAEIGAVFSEALAALRIAHGEIASLSSHLSSVASGELTSSDVRELLAGRVTEYPGAELVRKFGGPESAAMILGSRA